MSAPPKDKIPRLNSPRAVANRIFQVGIQKPCLSYQLASLGKIKAGRVTHFADPFIAEDNALGCINVVISILKLLRANLEAFNT